MPAKKARKKPVVTTGQLCDFLRSPIIDGVACQTAIKLRVAGGLTVSIPCVGLSLEFGTGLVFEGDAPELEIRPRQ